jgi:hypothetical protein
MCREATGRSIAGKRLMTRLLVAMAVALFAAAAVPAQSQDVLYSSFPERPKDDVGVHRVQATLIGYDPNAGPYVLAPYVIVRFGQEPALTRVFMAYRTTIDGAPFVCPSASSAVPAPSHPVCPRLPPRVALRLPVLVELTVWHASMHFQPGDTLATDSITLLPSER